MSLSKPKVCRTETVMSGRSIGVSAVPVVPGAEAMRIIGRSGRESRVAGPVKPSPGREITRLENRIRLVDDLQPLLGLAIAAMRVGMVQFHQRLVARLEVGAAERVREIEHGERLLLLGEGALATLARRLLVLEPEHAVIAPACVKADAEAAAERPSGTLPHRIVPNLRLDLRCAHARIIIPSRIVVAHVVETKPVEHVQPLARARRAIVAGSGAAGMVA